MAEEDIAHNVYMARGRNEKGEEEEEERLLHTRIFVWARNNVVGAKAGASHPHRVLCISLSRYRLRVKECTGTYSSNQCFWSNIIMRIRIQVRVELSLDPDPGR